jgi:hypothetical protein
MKEIEGKQEIEQSRFAKTLCICLSGPFTLHQRLLATLAIKAGSRIFDLLSITYIWERIRR